MSNIPKSRDLIAQLIGDIIRAATLDGAKQLTGEDIIKRLHEIVALLYREPPCRKAPAKPHRFSAEEKRLIKRMVRENPDATFHDIAQKLGIRNGGRISEIMHGKR